MELQEIGYGSEASSAVLNNNFKCLDEKIHETNSAFDDFEESMKSKFVALEASISSQIATFQNQFSTKMQETENNLSKVSTTVSSLLQNIIPDYTKGETIATGYVATKAGWVNWNGGAAGDGSTRRLYINDIEVGYHNYYKYGDRYRCQFLVGKGDKVTFQSGTSAIFFPCKGEV